MVKDSGAGCFVSCAIDFALKKVKVSVNVKVEKKKIVSLHPDGTKI